MVMRNATATMMKTSFILDLKYENICGDPKSCGGIIQGELQTEQNFPTPLTKAE